MSAVRKPARETTFVDADRCRRPRCNRPAVCRGVCITDYQVAYQLVSEGTTTWEELERSGKVDEPRRGAKQWFLTK